MNFSLRFCLIAVILLWSSENLTAQLQADFTMDKPGGCLPVAISFTNRTIGASAGASYHWDFGNGNSSSLRDGGAVYTSQQTYTVTLTVTDGSKTSSKTAQATVYKPPTIDFSASVAKGCLPLPVTFTAIADPGSGFVSSYTWDFGDGNTLSGNTNNQAHTYSVVQDPIVSLTVTNNYGCHTTVQKTGLLTVIPAVIPRLSADKNFLCLITDPVQFSNTSTGPGTLSYLWDFGDGNTSTQKNPQYVFNKKGAYSVKLQVTSSEGCIVTGTLSNTLNVANFTTDFKVPTPLCINSNYDIVSSSNPQPDNSAWYVDGSLYTMYTSMGFWSNTPGTHTISLTNNFGACTQTVSKNVVVNDLPSPVGFTYAEQGKCGPPETIVFTDNSNAVKQEWDFSYNNYEPNITASGKQPAHVYPDGNTYHNIWLRSTSAAGCSITTSQTIFIFPPRIYIYSDGNETTCDGKPNTQHFTCSRTDLTSYLWHFGDGTTSTEIAPAYTYTQVGGYSVYLEYTTSDGCHGTSNYLQFYVSAPLKFDFTASATSICGNTPVEFYPVTNGQNIMWYNWNFGDGTSDMYSWHVYNQPGTYTVSAYATNSVGCSAYLSKTNYVTVAGMFSTYTGHGNTCNGDRGDIVFTETTTGASRLIWDFGDGTKVTTAGDITQLKHNYAQNGTYTMKLTAVNDQYGCSITREDPQVYVFHKQHPVLTADKTAICISDLLHVKIGSYEMNPWVGPIFNNYSEQYQYGDGSFFIGYAVPTYWANANSWEGDLNNFEKGKSNLRVITNSLYFNCNDTSNFVPLAIRGARAGFEVVQSNQCFQSPVILKDTSTVDPGNSIVSWAWDFSDGTILSQSGTVSHIYASPGMYPVRLTVKDASGCTATSSNNITSYVFANGPKASFTTSGNDVPLNTTVNFYNSTNTYGSYNTVYSWDFGDGGSSSIYWPSHTYPVAGSYTVTLTSSDPVTGCSSTASQTINVANFNSAFSFTKSYVSGACPPVLVNFRNTSINYTSVKWDFGDGVTADNLNQASHIFKDPGKYIITLTVFGYNGLQEQTIDSIFVKVPSASLAAYPLDGCIGTVVRDTAISLNASTYIWDFGDGTVINSPLPATSHIYHSSGIYKPKLLVQDATGCNTGTDLNGEINIHPNPVATIAPSNPLICQGSNLQLQADGGLTYKWTPNTGLSNDAIATPVASPTLTTTYHLDIADDLGCQNTASVTVTVVTPGNLQTGNDTTVCEGNSVQLNASGEEVYNWIDNTEGLSNTGIHNPVAKPLTTTTYTVTGTDANNCFPQTAQVKVNVLPLPWVNAGQDTTIQAGASFVLQGSGSSDIVKWNWTPAKYLSCSDCALPLCTIRENMQYTLEATSANGCSSADQVIVKMECDEARVSIPNAFTPNRDQLNDLFVIRGISFVKHMVIYDRWGSKVFERTNFSPADPASCWDGNQNGMPSASGTYVYFVEMECPSGGAFNRKGTVTLIR